MRWLRHHRAAALTPLLLAKQAKAARADQDIETVYYGAYGGGIGKRVGLDAAAGGLEAVPGCPVTRLALFSERHETLRQWATADNWRKATARHKAWYFTRTENLTQEKVVDQIRQPHGHIS